MSNIDYSNFKDGELGRAPLNVFKTFSLGNKRRNRSIASRESLKNSIAAKGIIQPVLVRVHPDNPKELELLAGYGRRDQAIVLNESGRDDIHDLPFLFRSLNDQEAYECHLLENLEREDLSIVDESIAAKEFMSLYEGDIEAAASRLNLTVKTLRERLELNKCSSEVLDAIVEGTISPSHGLILAPFGHNKQNATLEVIVSEGWTVKTLRQRAAKAQIPLEAAKFDTTDCNACEFNTAPQLGLFENVETKALCSKNQCFQEKTQHFLNVEREKAKNKYGTVLFLSESGDTDRNNVCADLLGEQQVTACNGCTSRVAIMNDSWGKEGSLILDQCVDKVCWTKCNKSFNQSLNPTTENEQSTNSNKVTKDNKKAKSLGKAKASPQIKERHQLLLREAAAKHFSENNHFNRCVIFAAIISQTKFQFEGCTNTSFDSVLLYAFKNLDATKTQSLIGEAISHFLIKTDTVDHNTVTSTLIKMLRADSEAAMPTVINHWEPTEKNLKIFTITDLIPLAESAGVKSALDNEKEGSFKKLTNGSKGALIKGLTNAPVDYSNFAPQAYLDLLK